MNRVLSFVLGAAVLGGVALICWNEWRTHQETMHEVEVDEPLPSSEPVPAEAEPAAKPASVVAGTVRLPDGRPAVGAVVTLFQQKTAWPECNRVAVPGATVTTGFDGAFRFDIARQPHLLVEFAHSQYAGGLVDAPEYVDALELRLRTGYEVSGRVFNARGIAMPGVRVSCEATAGDDRRAEPWTLTEADGSYRFANVAAGPVRLVARHEAWQPAVLNWTMAGLGRGRDLRFATPALSVSGRVVDAATESPIENAEVLALGAGLEAGYSNPLPVRTDSQGVFVVPGLGRGNLQLEVRHPSFGTVARTVAVGQQLSEVTFELPARSSVAGRIVTLPGLSVKGIRLLLRSAANELAQTEVAADGSFAFADRVTPGWASLEVASGKLAFAESTASSLQVHIDEGHSDRLELPVRAPSVIAGRVVDDRGQAIEGAWLSVVQSEAVRDRLMQAGSALLERNLTKLGEQVARTAGGSLDALLAVTDAVGGFRIQGLPAGAVSLRVQHPGHGTRQVAFEVPAVGAVRQGLEVRMSPACRIRGRVQRGLLPLAGAQVDVKAEGMLIRAVTGIDGRYELTDLPPGNYRVRARYATLSALSEQIAAIPAQAVTVDVEFRSARVINGTVVDGSKQPVEGALIVSAAGDSTRVTSDADGRFQIELDSERAVGGEGPKLAVYYGDLTKPAAIFDVPVRGDRVTIPITIEKLCVVRGRILGLPGKRKLPAVLVRAIPLGNRSAAEPPLSRWIELQAGMLLQPLVRPGSWRILVSAEGHAPFVKDVDVREGGEVDLEEVVLEPGCTLRGRVVDAASHPVAAAEVFLGREEDLDVFPVRARTDADGVFVVQGASSSADNLVVRARGFATTSRQLRLPQDLLADSGLLVTLDRGATLQVFTGLLIDGQILLEQRGRVIAAREVEDLGIVVFEHLGAGDYTVKVAGDAKSEVPVHIERGKAVVDVRLR